MTANAGYHAYATGDVLTAAQVQYNLQNQTVMYFATTTARDAALTGAILVEGMVSYTPATGVMYYNGTAWTAVGSSSPLTTKGDLYTYSTTNARLAVGTNGQTLVANSGGTTGNAWQDPVQQNPVLNSAFQVWQRGTSIAGSTTAFTADRWNQYRAVAGSTCSRQVTGDTTNLPFIQYAARVQRDSGNTAVNPIQLGQSIETINSIPFAGKTVTLSFYARAGANYSSASSALSVSLYSGTGTDQNNMTGSYTGLATPVTGTSTLTTTWQRFQFTGTVATTATELCPTFQYTPVGTAGTNDYFEITGVQLEVGSVATPFHTFSTTIQGELAACQRYYIRKGADSTNTGAVWGQFVATSTTQGWWQVPLPVQMRVAPTAIDYSGGRVTNVGTTTSAASAITLGSTTMSVTTGSGYLTTTTIVAGSYYWLTAASASDYIGFTAEL